MRTSHKVMLAVAWTVIVICLALALSRAARAEYKGLTQIRYANAFCESGGDPYNRRNRTYRGKWQFDQWTWNRFAPKWLRGKDPAYVHESYQDMVALRVTYDAWPNC